MCYHFMFLKPIDSHGSFSSLPCLYLILFAIALHCFKVLYSNLRFWQDSISWGLIFAILKEGIKFHNFSIFNFILFFKNSELFKIPRECGTTISFNSLLPKFTNTKWVRTVVIKHKLQTADCKPYRLCNYFYSQDLIVNSPL